MSKVIGSDYKKPGWEWVGGGGVRSLPGATL